MKEERAAGGERTTARVLVADDDTAVCALLARALKPGFSVTTVHDAHDALELLAGDESFALIISDSMLPGSNGPEMIQSIRSRPAFSETPILVLWTPEGVEGEGAANAADAVLGKPFSVAELRATVRSLVRA